MSTQKIWMNLIKIALNPMIDCTYIKFEKEVQLTSGDSGRREQEGALLVLVLLKFFIWMLSTQVNN
jgi:hypothetical protein